MVHDCQGNAIASLSEQAPLPFSPVIVEAMAVARALTFAQELGINEFMIDEDSEAVINTLRSTEASLTTYGHLLESAKSTLVTSKCIAFTHIRRSGSAGSIGELNRQSPKAPNEKRPLNFYQ